MPSRPFPAASFSVAVAVRVAPFICAQTYLKAIKFYRPKSRRYLGGWNLINFYSLLNCFPAATSWLLCSAIIVNSSSSTSIGIMRDDDKGTAGSVRWNHKQHLQ